MAVTINNISGNNLNLTEYVLLVDATVDDPPAEYSIDGVNYQASNQFIVPNNVGRRYNIYVRDQVTTIPAHKSEYFEPCGIEVNKNNFVRWKNYENLIIDDEGNIIPVECPGVVLGNDTPLEVIGHCIVIPEP